MATTVIVEGDSDEEFGLRRTPATSFTQVHQAGSDEDADWLSEGSSSSYSADMESDERAARRGVMLQSTCRELVQVPNEERRAKTAWRTQARAHLAAQEEEQRQRSIQRSMTLAPMSTDAVGFHLQGHQLTRGEEKQLRQQASTSRRRTQPPPSTVPIVGTRVMGTNALVERHDQRLEKRRAAGAQADRLTHGGRGSGVKAVLQEHEMAGDVWAADRAQSQQRTAMYDKQEARRTQRDFRRVIEQHGKVEQHSRKHRVTNAPATLHTAVPLLLDEDTHAEGAEVDHAPVRSRQRASQRAHAQDASPQPRLEDPTEATAYRRGTQRDIPRRVAVNVPMQGRLEDEDLYLDRQHKPRPRNRGKPQRSTGVEEQSGSAEDGHALPDRRHVRKGRQSRLTPALSVFDDSQHDMSADAPLRTTSTLMKNARRERLVYEGGEEQLSDTPMVSRRQATKSVRTKTDVLVLDSDYEDDQAVGGLNNGTARYTSAAVRIQGRQLDDEYFSDASVNLVKNAHNAGYAPRAVPSRANEDFQLQEGERVVGRHLRSRRAIPSYVSGAYGTEDSGEHQEVTGPARTSTFAPSAILGRQRLELTVSSPEGESTTGAQHALPLHPKTSKQRTSTRRATTQETPQSDWTMSPVGAVNRVVPKAQTRMVPAHVSEDVPQATTVPGAHQRQAASSTVNRRAVRDFSVLQTMDDGEEKDVPLPGVRPSSQLASYRNAAHTMMIDASDEEEDSPAFNTMFQRGKLLRAPIQSQVALIGDELEEDAAVHENGQRGSMRHAQRNPRRHDSMAQGDTVSLVWEDEGHRAGRSKPQVIGKATAMRGIGEQEEIFNDIVTDAVMRIPPRTKQITRRHRSAQGEAAEEAFESQASLTLTRKGRAPRTGLRFEHLNDNGYDRPEHGEETSVRVARRMIKTGNSFLHHLQMNPHPAHAPDAMNMSL